MVRAVVRGKGRGLEATQRSFAVQQPALDDALREIGKGAKGRLRDQEHMGPPPPWARNRMTSPRL